MLVVFLLGLFACQEPFGTDRHRLEGLRIAAVRAPVREDVVYPEAVVVHEGRLWSEAPLALDWFRVADASEAMHLSTERTPDATGPTPSLTADGSMLALRVTTTDGSFKTAVVRPHPDTLHIDGIRIRAVPALSTTGATAEDLALDHRRALEAVELETPFDGESFLRITADGAENATVRWMAAGGTFFELEPHETDWAPADITVDDEDIEILDPVDRGVFPLLALALDPDGGVAWRSADLVLGAPAGWALANGHFLPSEETVPAGFWVEGTLTADASAPAGLRLSDAVIATEPADPQRLNTLLPCTSAVSGPFDPYWLATQRCSTGQLTGQRVVVEIQP